MKKTYLLGGFMALLLLVGVGCQTEPKNTPAEKINEADEIYKKYEDDNDQKKEDKKIDTSEYKNLFQGDEGGDTLEDEVVEDFELKAKAMGDRKVRFEWKVSDEIGDKAEAYRFARGNEKDPTYPSNWWWERGPAHRELEWEELPTGPAHFRVCAVINDECQIYSNDVEVVVE